ncbi:hypothetical protein ABZ509_25320, partial [Streptomyces lavendulocolor]
ARASLKPLVFEGAVTAGGALMNTTDVGRPGRRASWPPGREPVAACEVASRPVPGCHPAASPVTSP